MSAIIQPKSKIEVRLARPDDLRGLLVLWRELMALHDHPDGVFSLAPDAASTWRRGIEDLLARDDSFVFVAEEPNLGLLGFCSGWVAKNPAIYALRDVGFLCDMVVGEAHRRQGIGGTLLTHARAWFARRALEEFQLSSAVWNEQAHRFWRASGGAPLLLRFRFALEEEVWPTVKASRDGEDATSPSSNRAREAAFALPQQGATAK